MLDAVITVVKYLVNKVFYSYIDFMLRKPEFKTLKYVKIFLTLVIITKSLQWKILCIPFIYGCSTSINI